MKKIKIKKIAKKLLNLIKKKCVIKIKLIKKKVICRANKIKSNNISLKKIYF